MVVKVTSAVGSLATPWMGLEILTSVAAITSDGKGLFYEWGHASVPGGLWRLTRFIDYFPAQPNDDECLIRQQWLYKLSGVSIAQSTDFETPPLNYSTGWPSQQYAAGRNLTRIPPVTLAQWDFSHPQYGGAKWNLQPEYKPYVTRP
jgi:hypothetical protein